MILGFIVVGSGASELGNYHDGPDQGLILSGVCATLFKTRRAAERAIERTKAYASVQKLDWSTQFMHVLPVKSFKRPAKPVTPRKFVPKHAESVEHAVTGNISIDRLASQVHTLDHEDEDENISG